MQNALQIVYLIPLLPLIGFLINGLGRKHLSKSLISIIGSGVILGSFALSIWVFLQVKGGNTGDVHYFDFISVGSLRIPFAFKIDQLSTLFLLIITGVGFLIHVYSTSYMHEEKAEHFGRYFSYLNLFVFSMLLLVMGANFVIMFIGWEGVGLCSYLLIGYWFKNQEYNKAANKAFIMNRIGDLAFLIAIFWLINKLGTVSYDEVFTSANLAKLKPADITAITLLLFVGATGKSAQIPLYTWLPDAMAGPTPVSALIHAATMVTAGIYMIARSNVLYSMSPITMDIVAYIGLATALLAATIALKQNDIKKVLAYSTVSQLGFMFLALGCGAYTAAVFHVMTHAFFKALLFLGSGSVIHAMSGEQDIRNMGGLSKKLKITFITFLIGCIAIAGIPPFSGFFSKDAILLSAFIKSPVLYGIALFTALLTAFYMFRLLFITFSGKFRGTQEQEHHLHESPAAMTIPLIILAVLSIIGGFVGVPEVFIHGGDKLGEFLSPVIATHGEHAVSHSTEYILMILSTGLVALMIIFAWFRFKNYKRTEETGFGKVLENKWYVDELYDKIIVNPLHRVGAFLRSVIETKVVDGLVNGVGRMVNYSSRQLRLLQSGQVGSYILLMVLSMVADLCCSILCEKNMIAVLLIILPLLTGLVTFFFRNDKAVRSWALFSAVLTLLISVLGLTLLKEEKYLQFSCEWMPALGSRFSVKLDGMGQMLCLLNAIAYPLVILSTWNNFYKKPNNFFALMLLAQAGMMGVFLATDALLFYFFWELALIPMYFLCSQWGGEKRIAVTFKFFIYTFLGSLLMLIGILFIQSKTPGHSFSLEAFIDSRLAAKDQQWIFWLFFVAFAIKMPIFPLHTWQPDTYEQAPTATTMILSGVMVKMGVFGMLRWLFPVLPFASFQWADFITPLALIGAIYASLIAIRQDDLKRLVAYSSIAHIGLICAAAFAQNNSGFQGLMIQMFNHGINIIGMWIVVEITERQLGTRKISELGGIAQKAPVLAAMLVIVALANIALPLTNAFPGEFLMFNGIFGSVTAYNIWFTVLAGLGIILGAVYTLNMIRKVFYGETNELTAFVKDISWKEKIALGLIVLLIFVLGVYPQMMLNETAEAAGSLTEKFDFIRQTLLEGKK